MEQKRRAYAEKVEGGRVRKGEIGTRSNVDEVVQSVMCEASE